MLNIVVLKQTMVNMQRNIYNVTRVIRKYRNEEINF